MNAADPKSEVLVNLAPDNKYVVMTIFSKSGQRLYEISLSDAKALSRELIELACRVEPRCRKNAMLARTQFLGLAKA